MAVEASLVVSDTFVKLRRCLTPVIGSLWVFREAWYGGKTLGNYFKNDGMLLLLSQYVQAKSTNVHKVPRCQTPS